MNENVEHNDFEIKGYYWDSEALTRLDHLLANGKSVQDCAEYFHVSRERIYQVMRDNDIMPPRIRKMSRG